MSENLRAPDPTLTALGNIFVKVDYDQQVPVAHLWAAENPGPGRYPLACGRDGWLFPQIEAKHVAYVAVPCRECLPDAPKPGHVRCCVDLSECIYHDGWMPGRGLAWQVTP